MDVKKKKNGVEEKDAERLHGEEFWGIAAVKDGAFSPQMMSHRASKFSSLQELICAPGGCRHALTY